MNVKRFATTVSANTISFSNISINSATFVYDVITANVITALDTLYLGDVDSTSTYPFQVNGDLFVSGNLILEDGSNLFLSELNYASSTLNISGGIDVDGIDSSNIFIVDEVFIKDIDTSSITMMRIIPNYLPQIMCVFLPGDL